MIPTPPPIVPVLVLISLAVLMLFATAIKAWRGAIQRQGDPRIRRWGIAAAGISTVLAAGGVMLGGTVTSTYQGAYERAVWSALSVGYGVEPVSPGLGFRPGVAFDARIAGHAASCLVQPPSLVVCDDKRVQPLGGTAQEGVKPSPSSPFHLS